MAITSTIFKAELSVSDMDRHYYQTHHLTLARHPSETDSRLMLRLLAFALFADENLTYGAGISSDDEPDLWIKNLTGETELWIDLGLPSEKRIRQACGKSSEVVLLCHGSRGAMPWWKKMEQPLHRFKNLRIYFCDDEVLNALTGLCKRNMQLQCGIQDGEIWMNADSSTVNIQLESWK
jgi:uncharacterized protein YaeQ